MASVRRKALDSWFPTLARYAGLVMMGHAALIDQGQNPALIPAATGLIFLKNFLGGNGNGNEKKA